MQPDFRGVENHRLVEPGSLLSRQRAAVFLNKSRFSYPGLGVLCKQEQNIFPVVHVTLLTLSFEIVIIPLYRVLH